VTPILGTARCVLLTQAASAAHQERSEHGGLSL
jgi:hypothetical protein